VSTSMYRLVIAVVAAAVAVCGVVLLATISYGDVGRRPWLPIGVALVAAGGVGLLISAMMWAMWTEDRTARRMARPESRDPHPHG
jgi:hypothetical protein